MDVTIENINKHGFVFHKYDTYLVKDTLKLSSQNLFNYIKDLISVDGERLHYDVDTIHKGQEIRPHFHIIPGSFQVVVWLPNSPFEGRDYLYGTKNSLKKYHPEKGVMCFMKPNDPNFIHGVSELISDTSVTTVGFSSLSQPFEEGRDYDIYVDNFKLEESYSNPI